MRPFATTAAIVGASALLLAGCSSSDNTASPSASSAATTTNHSSHSSSASSSSATSSTTSSAADKPVEAFCKTYGDYLLWSMSQANSTTLESAHAMIGQPVTEAQRQAMRAVLAHTVEDGKRVYDAAPNDIRDDVATNNEFLASMWQARLDSPVGILAPKPNDEQRAAGERILSYTDAHCPGLPVA